jgi:D-3-phosphoglycerate dehydrogenase
MRILHLDQNHEYLSSELEKLGFENHYDYKSSKDEILEKIEDYVGIIIRSRIIIDDEIIKSANKLKFIARIGAGLENIDLISAKKIIYKYYQLVRQTQMPLVNMLLECY